MKNDQKAGTSTRRDKSDQQQEQAKGTKSQAEQDEKDIEEVLHQGKPRDVDALNNDPNADTIPTGIQTGATTRGSYSTDQSTGGGGYSDHRSGKFGTAPVAQPSNDQEREPDPKAKGF